MDVATTPPPTRTVLDAAYAHQRSIHATEMVKAFAWHEFGSSDVHTASPDDAQQRALIDRVVDFCITRKISKIPDIFIIQSSIPNAASLDGSSLVFTTKIMEIMPPEQLDAIIGHELSHHRHRMRDWVMQGALGGAGALAGGVAWTKATSALSHIGVPRLLLDILRSERVAAGPQFIAAMSALVPYRHFMEFESDKEGAQLTSPRQMIGALSTLEQHSSQFVAEHDAPQDWKRRITQTLLFPFSSHPSTDRRIARLEKMEQRGNFSDRVRAESSVAPSPSL